MYRVKKQVSATVRIFANDAGYVIKTVLSNGPNFIFNRYLDLLRLVLKIIYSVILIY